MLSIPYQSTHFVVKSISFALLGIAVWEHVHAPFGRRPQAQLSVASVFSVEDFSQSQCMAAFLPQLHLASAAHTHPAPLERPQQFFGTTPVAIATSVRWFGEEVIDVNG